MRLTATQIRDRSSTAPLTPADRTRLEGTLRTVEAGATLTAADRQWLDATLGRLGSHWDDASRSFVDQPAPAGEPSLGATQAGRGHTVGWGEAPASQPFGEALRTARRLPVADDDPFAVAAQALSPGVERATVDLGELGTFRFLRMGDRVGMFGYHGLSELPPELARRAGAEFGWQRTSFADRFELATGHTLAETDPMAKAVLASARGVETAQVQVGEVGKFTFFRMGDRVAVQFGEKLSEPPPEIQREVLEQAWPWRSFSFADRLFWTSGTKLTPDDPLAKAAAANDPSVKRVTANIEGVGRFTLLAQGERVAVVLQDALSEMPRELAREALEQGFAWA